MFKTLTAATAITLLASTAFAGSLGAPAQDDKVDDKAVYVPTGSGIGAPAIVGGVLAAVAIAALVSNDDDDDAVDGHGSDLAD